MKNLTPRRHMIFYIYAIISQIILIMIVQVECDWLVQCDQCKCKWNSGKKTADCKNQSLTGVPIDLSSELQVLDLSYNHIVRIEENAFTKAKLQNLHKLFIRNCSIERLHPISLRGLEILIELDLSSNLIKTLPRDAFISLVKVRSLILNQNLLEILENGLIRNLKYLHKIELKGNRIKRINTDAFQNVPYLSQIFLNDNQLKFLRKEPFEKLKRLASLSLDGNPWNCTCELQIFRDFVIKRNLYTPPTSCYYPLNLRDMLWNDEQLHQQNGFACKPKIIYPSRGASINTSKENVTLICRVHASPNTIIAWDYNKQIYSSLNYQARVHIQLLREESNGQILESKSSTGDGSYEKDIIGRDIFISRLTIIGAEKSDEGIYTCLAENPGGKDEVQMSLLVQKHNNQDLLFQNNIIIIICLMVLGLLSASIFLAMITCCIYKRFKAMNQQHNHRHGHNHHHHHHNIGGNGTTTMDSDDTVDVQKHFHQHAVNVNTLVNDINVATTDSSGNLQHHNNKDSCYVEIQPQKVILNGNGHLIGSSINNFTDLNDNERRYHEINNENSLPQNHQITNNSSTSTASAINPTAVTITRTIKTLPTTETNKNKLNEHHNGGEYQPDLLPYNTNPQSILLQNSNLYNGYVQSSLYDTEQPQQQQQQQQERHKINNKISSSNNLSGQYHQIQKDQKQIDLNPVPTTSATTTTTKLTGSMNQIYQENSGGRLNDHHHYSNNSKYITDQTSEYLQTGYLKTKLGGDGRYNTLQQQQQQPSSLPLTETLNRHNPLQNSDKLIHNFNQQQQQNHHQEQYIDNINQKISPMTNLMSSSLRQLYQNNDDALEKLENDETERYYRETNYYQPRRSQSIVTTSPSLNFLTTNYYPRRQLL